MVGITPVTLGITLVMAGITPCDTGVMPAGTGVMLKLAGVMLAEGRMSPADTGVMSAVMFAASEEAAGFPLPAVAMPVPSGVSWNRTRVFRVTTGVTPVTGRLAAVLAFVSLGSGGGRLRDNVEAASAPRGRQEIP